MYSKRKYLIVAGTLCLILLLSCKKDYDYHSANYYPSIGDTITISERGTPSNGIYWDLRNEPKTVIELVDKGWIADRPGVRGGNGTWFWKLVAFEHGSVVLDYWYWRPYEGKKSIEAKHQFKVVVR